MAIKSGRIAAAWVLLWAMSAYADPATQPANISIIPRPVSMTVQDGQFVLGQWTHIDAVSGEADLAKYLAQTLDAPTGYTLPVDLGGGGSDGQRPNFIHLKLVPVDQLKPLGEYSLTVAPSDVTIESQSEAGLFSGIQTLRQLLPPQIYSQTAVENVSWTVPCVQIEDYPRFQWRGMMLDCSRHFFPKEEVERFIDLMAIHKMNVLHWHLTDDQGWRIQILKYPKLTDIGAWRKQTLIGHEEDAPDASEKYDGVRYGGFYTQDDIREIVKYAADRYVTIVPEIEMPGHSTAAVAAYPELGNTGKQIDVAEKWGIFYDTLGPQPGTIEFYKNVLDEVTELFPSSYIHLGGDEVPTDQWENSSTAQADIQQLGLKSVKDIQPYFLQQMAQYLASKGRRMIGWDEILKMGLPHDAVVMVWHKPSEGVAAIQAGNDVVMAPSGSTYFDAYQSKDHTKEPLAIGGLLVLKKVYQFNPVPKGLNDDDVKHILGAQGQLWSEYIPTSEHLEYMAFPREIALAEVVWSPVEGKDYADFSKRLIEDLQRLDVMKVNYRRPLPGE